MSTDGVATGGNAAAPQITGDGHTWGGAVTSMPDPHPHRPYPQTGEEIRARTQEIVAARRKDIAQGVTTERTRITEAVAALTLDPDNYAATAEDVFEELRGRVLDIVKGES